jgi:23S rRNA (adenine2503-C2)-methyltransferase
VPEDSHRKGFDIARMNPLDLDVGGWEALMAAWGEPPYHGRQVYAGLWRRGDTYKQMTDLPAALRRRLDHELPLPIEVLDERGADGGRTLKALLRIGRHDVEAVVMGYPDRVTACVSSQAGCAMDCGFCATGRMGLLGNLSAGEIAAQVRWARAAAERLPDTTPGRLTNVVFMGMGEPMSNYRAVREAVQRLLDPAGIGLAARHVTVSTVGVAPGIRRLGIDHPQVGLAVSLHAADDALRGRLVPANRLWPLAEVETAVHDWRERTGRRPSIEWAMIRDVNDDDRQAALLVPIARRLRAHVNLIPMNPILGSPWQPSIRPRLDGFVHVLESAGVTVTVRDTRGRQIEAACGQLRLEHDRSARA